MSVVVEGSGSRMEARGSGFETRFGPEYLTTIPSRRYSMFDAIGRAAGVSPTSPSSGTVNTVAAFGSGGNENLFLIDGTNFTCPCSGVARAEPSVDVIQEMQVQSVGVSAEYGNIQGTVFNVVTKQGGDRFQYDASYYGQASGLTSQPVLLAGARRASRRPDTSATIPGLHHESRRTRGARQGLVLRAATSTCATTTASPARNRRSRGSTSRTRSSRSSRGRLTPGLQLVQSFHDEFWVNPQVPTLVTPFVATQRQSASVPTMTFAQLTHTVSANTLWERAPDDSCIRETTIRARAIERRRTDSIGVTGVSSGNAPQLRRADAHPDDREGDTHATTSAGCSGADHELKVGRSDREGRTFQPQVIPGRRQVRRRQRPAIPGHLQRALEQRRRVPDRGGVCQRWPAQSEPARRSMPACVSTTVARSARTSRLSMREGRETGETIDGLGTLYTWNVRVATLGRHREADEPMDGRCCAASYGRFNQGVLTGEISPIHPGAAPVTTMAFDASDRRLHDARVGRRSQDQPVDRSRDADAAHRRVSRSASIASSPSRLTTAVAYIRKSGSEFIAWTDIGGQYQQETRTLPDQRHAAGVRARRARRPAGGSC